MYEDRIHQRTHFEEKKLQLSKFTARPHFQVTKCATKCCMQDLKGTGQPCFDIKFNLIKRNYVYNLEFKRG